MLLAAIVPGHLNSPGTAKVNLMRKMVPHLVDPEKADHGTKAHIELQQS